MKAVQPHVHKFTKVVKKTNLVYDHRRINGEKTEPGVAGKDTIFTRKCDCGKTLAYELERTPA